MLRVSKMIVGEKKRNLPPALNLTQFLGLVWHTVGTFHLGHTESLMLCSNWLSTCPLVVPTGPFVGAHLTHLSVSGGHPSPLSTLSSVLVLPTHHAAVQNTWM